MSKGVTEELAVLHKKAAKMTTGKLRSEYDLGLRIVRDKLLWTACVLRELDRRGEKVDGDDFFIKLLRRISEGNLLVDVVVRFAGRPVTMAAVAGMDAEEQEKVLGMEEKEVEEYVRKKRGRAVRPYQPRINGNLQSLIAAVATADPKDVADTIMEIVKACSDPAATVEIVMAELKHFKPKKQAS